MKQKLIDYFSKIMPLTEEESKAILESMDVQTFTKGTVLLAEGQVSKACYFVLQGCVRQYSMVDGEEKTNNFFTEEQWVVSFQSFTQKIPATHFFACTEDTTLVVGTEEKENDLYARFPKFETISRKSIENFFGEQQELMSSYTTDNAEQRYLKLLNNRPDLIQRVPQYQLASYIGVKPESLSRMRKRMFAQSSKGTRPI